MNLHILPITSIKNLTAISPDEICFKIYVRKLLSYFCHSQWLEIIKNTLLATLAF